MAMELNYLDRPWLKHYEDLGLPTSLKDLPRRLIFELFDETAEELPDNVASVYYGKVMTYRELKLQVDKLATALFDLGVKKGDKVATLLLTSPQAGISLSAIPKIGAVWQPISTLLKAQEIERQLNESGAKTIIAFDTHLDLINSIKAKTHLKNIIITSQKDYSPEEDPIPKEVPGAHQFRDLISKHKPNPPKVDIDMDKDLAVLMFTGGATGVPKGVMLSHGNLSSFSAFMSIMPKPLLSSIRGRSSVIVCQHMYHIGLATYI